MSTRYFTLSLVAAASLATSAAADTIRIGGTGGALQLMHLASEPLRANSGADIEVLPSLGSAGALRALAAGAIEIAISARPLTAEETKPGFSVVPFARTPLVFVSSHPKPDPLSSTEIADKFASIDPRWRDGSFVNLILRPRTDYDIDLMIDLFPGMDAAVHRARRRPDLPVAATDQDSADLAERLPGSLVQAGLGQIIAEKRDLRVVTINGVVPSIEAMADGRYPFQKSFYLVYATVNAAPAERLLAFLRSPLGRELMRETGHLPVE